MKKILVVVDMQKDFTTGVLGNKQCVEAVDQVVDAIENGNYDEIVLTKDSHDENYLTTQEGKYLPVVHCVVGSDGWSLAPEVEKACMGRNKVHVVCKPTFGSLDLGMLLKNICREYETEGVEVHFCGVCTGICVISNVLIAKAYIPQVKISVIEHACACVTSESHRTAIEAMKTCQVEII